MTRQIPWQTVNALYQLPVRSFLDSNGDGDGDLRGVIDKLSYLHESLGVDALWLMPFYPTNMVDFGYDVKDFQAVDPRLGSLDDLRELVDRAHGLGMRIMIDIVANHTSDAHPWFEESRSSKDNPKRDWYIWRDPKEDGSAPNNWLSKFGDSVWTRDDATGQYYLHTFFKEQPDLNWENPAVRRAVHEVLYFWLDFGIDGVRIDAAIYIAKDPELRDNPKNPAFVEGGDERHRFTEENMSYGQRMVPYLRELAKIAAEYDERLVVFEAYPEGKQLTAARYLELYSIDPTVSMPLMLEGTWTPFGADEFRRVITEFQGMVNPKEHGVMYCFGNHDRSRIASRYGRLEARLIAMLQMTLPGVPVIYYGDELGMIDTKLHPLERRDQANQDHMPLGRDAVRTPMLWDTSRHGGFTEGTPWLPVGTEYLRTNAAAELRDENSFLVLYHELLHLRRTHDLLRGGDFETYGEADEQIFAFARRLGSQHIFVVLNFSAHETRHVLPHTGQVLCSTDPSRQSYINPSGELYLKPFEGVIVECKEHKLS